MLLVQLLTRPARDQLRLRGQGLTEDGTHHGGPGHPDLAPHVDLLHPIFRKEYVVRNHFLIELALSSPLSWVPALLRYVLLANHDLVPRPILIHANPLAYSV